MKVTKKLLIILLILVAITDQIRVYARTVDNIRIDDQIVYQYSEYDYCISVRKMIFTEANRIFGISRDSYDSVCNIEQSILILSELSDVSLRMRGLNELQISILKSYDGSKLENNPQLRNILATLSVTLTKINSSASSVKVRANWSWNSKPLITNIDYFETAAFRWKAYDSANNQITVSYDSSGSYCKVTYYYNNTALIQQTKSISVGNSNTHVLSQFTSAVYNEGNNCWAKTGYLVVKVTGSNISKVDFGFGYNHGISAIPSTVSLDSDLGFNYSNGYEMAEQSITINV